MTRRKLRKPALRTPALPAWDRGECRKCATPVRLVWVRPVVAQELTPRNPIGFEVGMKPAPRNDPRARVAAVTMNNRLEGRFLAKGERPDQTETVWILHQDVCPEIPRPTQMELPQEGDT